MEDEVGTYASFAARVGRASSELRELVGTEGRINLNALDSFMTESDEEDENIYDDTTIVVAPGDVNENADKTTLVIPPEELQGFLRETGINYKPRTGIKVMKDDGKFLCPICKHPFNQRENAFTHSYTHMNQLELEKVNAYHKRCPYSPIKIFFTRRKYADHINSHEGIKNFKCQICHKGFLQKPHLHCHMLIHVNEGSQEVGTLPSHFRHFQCYFCHKKYGSMYHLIRHMSRHTKETPYNCSYCNKWFTRKSCMSFHIRQFHTLPDNLKSFPCPQCPRICKHKGELTQHIQIVHGEKAYHCSICAKSFCTKQNLNVHIDSVHRKKRHQCPHCQTTYSRKNEVKRHIKKEHNE